MSKYKGNVRTSNAITSAARGELSIKKHSGSSRASNVYGFSNFALKKTRKEIKDAWEQASLSTKEV